MLGFEMGTKVSIEETADAFERVFGKGGKFGNASEELAKTLTGTVSMIGDKFFNIQKRNNFVRRINKHKPTPAKRQHLF